MAEWPNASFPFISFLVPTAQCLYACLGKVSAKGNQGYTIVEGLTETDMVIAARKNWELGWEIII